MIWNIIAILICVLLSSFFSASEMAYSSCNQIRLENFAEDGNKRAARALKLAERFDDSLSTILIGNNLVNIAASSLSSILVLNLLGSSFTWLSTVLITVIVVIFGETIPKIMAKQNATRYAIANARAIQVLRICLYPVTWLVVGLVNLITAGMKGEPEEDRSVEELQTIIDTAEDEDVLDEDQSELVKAAIDFSEVQANEVMTARVDMVALDIEDDWDEILEVVESSTYSRLPVYEDSIDNIIGVLYLNHFLKALTDEEQIDIRKLLMQPCYVYKTMKLPAVLNELRLAQQHLAIVTDEYGGTLGVVSMEDVLEQIVGEIWDETDIVEPNYTIQPNGSYEIDGDMAISEFLELMEIPEDEFDFDSDTVGGWAIELNNGFPEPEDQITYENLVLTILETEERRVEKLLIRRENPEPEE